MSAEPKAALLALDLVRFACAALVVAFHYLTVFPLASTSPTLLFDAALRLPGGGARWTWCGWVGVEVFFMVSGNVIALSAAGSTLRGFLGRRVLRLAPAAWVCASLTALVLLCGSMLGIGEIALRWLRSVAFWPSGAHVDTVYWTLAVETGFYLLVASVLRGRADDAVRLERIAYGLTLWSALYWGNALVTGASPDAAVETPLRLVLMPHGAFFALGMLLWAIRSAGPSVWRIAGTALALATASVEITIHARTMIGVVGIDPSPLVPLALFATCVVVIAGASPLQRPLAKIGTTRIATLGRMTYPLYLLHQVVGAALIAGLCRAGMPGTVALTATALLVLGAAYLVATRAEPALRAWIVAGYARVFRPRRGLAPDTRRSAFPPAG